ncbi:CcmD family protein [Chloroflexota bacterium]
MENLNYLLAAFIIIWAVLFIYIAILSCRQRRLRREIDLLKTNPRQTPGRGEN